jgi:diguanylate cyclase (GGDEF)-like protein
LRRSRSNSHRRARVDIGRVASDHWDIASLSVDGKSGVVKRTLSRHNRYLSLIALLAVVAVGLVGGGFAFTESANQKVQADWEAAIALRSLGAALDDAASDQESALDDFMLSSHQSDLDRYEAAVTDAAAVIAEIRAQAVGISDLDKASAAVDADLKKWQVDFGSPAIAAVQAGGGAALDPFAKGSGNDHDQVDLDLQAVGAALGQDEVAVRARADGLAGTRTIITAAGLAMLLVAAGFASWLIRRYGVTLELDARQAGVLNRFTEVTSFESDDRAMAASALEALGLLVHPDAGVTHVLNRSKDRAVPEAATGDPIAEVLALDALSLCVGVVRGSMYVTDDASLPLSVRCPVYPVTSGTLACIPLSSGEAIGAVHLYWGRPNALSLEVRSSVVRITEHAALTIGNRRLLAALHGQANTDARTGLSNSRAFDQVLESELAAMANTDSLAVLMLDIDHFKDFNDRHGHPAGDEALRTFAGILRSCIRDGDLAARYGGEEFVVLLPGADETSARAVAERIRARTEQTIVPLGPGLTDRISVSIGIAMAPAHGFDRVTILRISDEALYRAKQGGRNRVEFDGGDGLTPLPSAAVA